VAIRLHRQLGPAIAWLVFPLVPVILEDAYYQVCNANFDERAASGPDPREWGWELWLMMLGPLVGFSFLAGATTDLPDDPQPRRRGLRRVLARRSVWVAIGPWSGFLILAGLYLGLASLADLANRIPAARPWNAQFSEFWKRSGVESALARIRPAYWLLGTVAIAAYGWLWPAWAALRRAARIGRWRASLYRGLLLAVAFVGSLFGSFWAATAWFRSYFFDPRLVPLVVVALSLAFTSGCAGTITYGEVRRRELFHAMLVAWVLGLAIMWRWWSRARVRR
jgi:hypothetical protein